MFNLLTCLTLAVPNMVLTPKKYKSYGARFVAHDATTEQDICIRVYYDLDTNPLASKQFESMTKDVPTVTIIELVDLVTVINGCTLCAKVTQL